MKGLRRNSCTPALRAAMMAAAVASVATTITGAWREAEWLERRRARTKLSPSRFLPVSSVKMMDGLAASASSSAWRSSDSNSTSRAPAPRIRSASSRAAAGLGSTTSTRRTCGSSLDMILGSTAYTGPRLLLGVSFSTSG